MHVVARTPGARKKAGSLTGRPRGQLVSRNLTLTSIYPPQIPPDVQLSQSPRRPQLPSVFSSSFVSAA